MFINCFNKIWVFFFLNQMFCIAHSHSNSHFSEKGLPRSFLLPIVAELFFLKITDWTNDLLFESISGLFVMKAFTCMYVQLSRSIYIVSILSVAATNVIAFYAYMGQTEVHPGPHHTIIFDVPVTNIGNGYNHFSGIFSVPSSGVYVFSWTIGDSSGGSIFTELVVNKDVVGGILTQSMFTADRFTTTGLVVKEVTESDVVYVRTSSTGGIHGDIQSLNPVQRTSFSGWRLA